MDLRFLSKNELLAEFYEIERGSIGPLSVRTHNDCI